MTQALQLQKQAPKLTKKPKATGGMPESSFSDHIAELRKRVFLVLLVFVIASSLAYNYRDGLLGVIMAPLEGAKLIYLTPGGGFNFIFQISLYAGLLAAAPMLIYQLYGFIRPALPKRAQRSSAVVVAVAFLLMLCGVAFGYFVAVPSALHFLTTFAGDAVSPSLTADSYLSFFLAYIAGLGVLFELPLLLLFLHWINPMTPGKLLKSERFVIVFAFVAAALITPTPDMLNQAMIAVPLILIYQMGVIAVLIAIKRERRNLLKTQRKQEVTTPVTAVDTPKKIASSHQSIAPSPVSAPAPVVSQTALAPRPKTMDGFVPRSVSVRPLPDRQLRPLIRPQAVQASRPPRPGYRRSLPVDGFTSR